MYEHAILLNLREETFSYSRGSKATEIVRKSFDPLMRKNKGAKICCEISRILKSAVAVRMELYDILSLVLEDFYLIYLAKNNY